MIGKTWRVARICETSSLDVQHRKTYWSAVKSPMGAFEWALLFARRDRIKQDNPRCTEEHMCQVCFQRNCVTNKIRSFLVSIYAFRGDASGYPWEEQCACFVLLFLRMRRLFSSRSKPLPIRLHDDARSLSKSASSACTSIPTSSRPVSFLVCIWSDHFSSPNSIIVDDCMGVVRMSLGCNETVSHAPPTYPRSPK